MKKQAHDPFAFGQVPLTKEPKPSSVEDMLFTAPTVPSDRSRDTSWDPPSAADEPAFRETPADSQPRRAFDEPIAFQPAQPDAAVVPARHTVRVEPAAQSEHLRSGETLARPIVAAPSGATAPAGATLAEIALPAVVLCACEGAAAWLWLSVGNPVLGALAGMLGVGLTAFAWFAMRR